MSAEAFYQQIESVNSSARPVESWNPPLSGDMDCLIRRDGSWQLDGRPLANEKMLRLFSTVLKKEGDDYFLVTPVEKWRIEVEDLPFQVVEMDIDRPDSKNQLVRLRTNVGDRVSVDASHPLGSSPIAGIDEKQVIPYVLVRDGLTARFNRNCFLQLAEILEPLDQAGQYKIVSANSDFVLSL